MSELFTTILYRASGPIVVEVVENEANRDFVRLKIWVEVEPKKGRECFFHQMLPRKKAIRLALTAHWCGVMIDRALGGTPAFNDVVRFPGKDDTKLEEENAQLREELRYEPRT